MALQVDRSKGVYPFRMDGHKLDENCQMQELSNLVICLTLKISKKLLCRPP